MRIVTELRVTGTTFVEDIGVVRKHRLEALVIMPFGVPNRLPPQIRLLTEVLIALIEVTDPPEQRSREQEAEPSWHQLGVATLRELLKDRVHLQIAGPGRHRYVHDRGIVRHWTHDLMPRVCLQRQYHLAQPEVRDEHIRIQQTYILTVAGADTPIHTRSEALVPLVRD